MSGGERQSDVHGHAPCRPPDPCQKAGMAFTCEQCVEFLLDYLDGVLPADQRVTFDGHLAACPDCRVYLSNYQRATALAGRVGRDERRESLREAPLALIDAILKSLKAQ